VTFDDDVMRAAAAADPIGFVRDLPGPATLDEVQRVPELFTTLKAAVDHDRTPGRFLLTGSANVFAIPRLADSLAGRMAVLRLFPMAQAELTRIEPTFLDHLLDGSFPIGRVERSGAPLTERMVAGGYPPALARRSDARRAAWYRDYVLAVTQRDVTDLARVAALDALPKLVEVVAGQTARLLLADSEEQRVVVRFDPVRCGHDQSARGGIEGGHREDQGSSRTPRRSRTVATANALQAPP
jgi:uncharacterized protein